MLSGRKGTHSRPAGQSGRWPSMSLGVMSDQQFPPFGRVRKRVHYFVAYTLSLPVHKPHINGIKRPTRMVNLNEKPVSPHRACGGSWTLIQWRAADIHEVERRPGP
jgi:hypothetical protein